MPLQICLNFYSISSRKKVTTFLILASFCFRVSFFCADSRFSRSRFSQWIENILGCKSTYFIRSWMQLNKRIAIVPFNILCREEILEPLKRIKKSHTKYKRLLLNTKVSNLTIKFRKLKWITMQWHDWLGGGGGGMVWWKVGSLKQMLKVVKETSSTVLR